MAPLKKEEDPVKVLLRGRVKRDNILNSVKNIHATALEARADIGKIPSLIIHAEELNKFVEQFQHQQDIIINALIDADRIAEFEQVDRPLITSMESMRLEIKTIVASAVPVSTSESKSSSSSFTNSVPQQQFVALPKIKLPMFDGNLLSWRSFRDIYISLVHDNQHIDDAQRFHHLLSCLSGSALAIIKSIPLSAANYPIAWDALSERYNNKRLLASAHMDKLFAFKPIAHESLPALIEFVNTFKENVSIIKSLGVDDLSSFLLFHMCSRVLDPTTLQLFESSTSQSTIPTFDELVNFVQHRCKILENLTKSNKVGRNEKPFEKPDVRGKHTKSTKSVFAATTPASTKFKTRNCLYCDKPDHRIYQCPKLTGMTVDKRRDVVLARKLCFACLSSSHMVNTCPSTKGCFSCNSKRHHTLLHREQNQTSTVDNTTSNSTPVPQPTTSSGNSSSFVGAACTNSTVVLGTAIVHIKDAWEQVHCVRVLLDSGSQISAMTSDCAARLGLSKRRYKSDIVGFAQSPVSHVQGITRCQFSSHVKPDYLFPSVDLVVLKQITTAMPATRLPATVRQQYQHLRLADDKFDTPSRIDVLFGADILPSLIRPHAGVEHHSGLPSALDTQLGWIIFGSFSTPNKSPPVTLTTAVAPPSIEDLIKKFWLIEEPAAPSSPTTEDQWCEEYFTKSTSRDTTGRFCVARTLHHVHSVLSSEVPVSRLRAWSDSSVVLSWLTSDQKHFKIFVTNRVAKISQLLPGCMWSYVSTNDNPADPASRGLLPKSMLSSSIYWNGPDFLRLPEDQWPQSRFIPLTPDQLPETRPNVITTLAVNVHPPSLEFIDRFSSLGKMLRVLSYILRYLCHRLRRQPVRVGPITFTERERSLSIAVQRTQQVYFSDLRKMLKSESMISPPSLAQLAPYVDEKGIIRVGGRLRFASASQDAKHPILLPRSSHLTELIIRHYHLSFLHGGSKLVLSMLSQKFWILSGRAAVRRVIFSCVPCTRHKAVRPQPMMADLPSYRVQPHRPFSHVGMDYGGPFFVKEHRRRNAQSVKVYLALFICMSVKAVHLEIVSDLSTEAFLAALDRFVARRGIPSNIYSDCGTNYVGAARQLKTLFRDAKVQDRLSSHLTCAWHFNPPAAPHFGGIWEAGIKSTKYHFKHAIGQQVLTYEEFLTLTTRIEGILNSRPITPTSSDPHDLSALTPGHFLIGQPLQALPEPDLTDVQINRLNRWQLIRQCHQSYWKRWSREYLSTLQGRHKWFKSSPNLTIGDMVIVEAPSRPPTEWRLGRVTEVHPGSDEVVRVVSVRTQDGVYKRPVVKLVRLPVEP
ncbi:uncharacterized protein LOC132945707 [Metopolophium dirhodum]|uniref:uncharacterized protein LOC132945707 n=1 Tax=Metopolophium dirhodum TaxID=44670 RepID=UPI0029902A99|nr:uncharacterized protein LOC132945707 [Metopolophium dirhodum]